MKKFFVILFILLFVPLSVSAETNYAKSLSWRNGLECSYKTDGLDVKFTNISYSFSSPYLDIRPAFQEAIGDKNEVTLILSMEIRADFKEGDESTFRLLLRCGKTQNANEWREYHQNNPACKVPFFDNYETSNIMKTIDEEPRLLTSRWQTVTTEITATKEQTACPMSPTWYFCIDGLNMEVPTEAIEIRNLTLTEKQADKSVFNVIRTARPIKTVTPNPTATPASTPTAMPTPTPNWLNQPIVWDMGAMTGITVFLTLIIIIVIGILYIVLTVKARKK